MAKYQPSSEEESLYGVSPPGEAPVPRGTPDQPAKEDKEPETTDEEIEQNQHSALVPNSVLTGPDGKAPKAGDEIVLKVVKVYGDEAEVAYAPAKKPGASEGPMSSADEEIEAMDQKGTY